MLVNSSMIESHMEMLETRFQVLARQKFYFQLRKISSVLKSRSAKSDVEAFL